MVRSQTMYQQYNLVSIHAGRPDRWPIFDLEFLSSHFSKAGRRWSWIVVMSKATDEGQYFMAMEVVCDLITNDATRRRLTLDGKLESSSIRILLLSSFLDEFVSWASWTVPLPLSPSHDWEVDVDTIGMWKQINKNVLDAATLAVFTYTHVWGCMNYIL